MTEIKTAVSKYCEGEKCRCGKPATQKIEQVIFDDIPPSHGYTQYVCQHHFDEVMRPYLSQSLPVDSKDADDLTIKNINMSNDENKISDLIDAGLYQQKQENNISKDVDEAAEKLYPPQMHSCKNDGLGWFDSNEHERETWKAGAKWYASLNRTEWLSEEGVKPDLQKLLHDCMEANKGHVENLKKANRLSDKQKEENENLKQQLREQIAGAAMSNESLLEINRKIKDNTIDKVIGFCDEKLDQHINGSPLSIKALTPLDVYKEVKQFLQSLK